MIALGQELQHGAGHAITSLYRLIRIGIRAERNRRTSIAPGRQFFAEQVPGVGLVKQPGFEIEARRKVDIAVARSCIAVNAAVLAAFCSLLWKVQL
jgi:hypothetical protein